MYFNKMLFTRKERQMRSREIPLKDSELQLLLSRIREVNRQCNRDQITGKERVVLHQALVPKIGKLRGVVKGRGGGRHGYADQKDSAFECKIRKVSKMHNGQEVDY